MLRTKALTALFASTLLATSPVLAQNVPAADDNSGPADIVVTATKRSESLQKVPISIQALGTEKLEQQQVSSFDDYAKLLPSVSFQSFGPGQSQLFFRGVSSGGDGLHIGPSPATGLYIDETPVTTIAGAVDLHIYDIARVEALSGPQGTLFGASSLSGTLRIITNKPKLDKFEGGVDFQINKFGKGAAGGSAEGFVNLPISSNTALRVVGFYQKDGGYIDNLPATRVFTLDDNDPTTNSQPFTNAALVKNNYNDVETYGGRAALKVDLDDNWTVTPSIIYQHQVSNGGFLFDPLKGDLKVTDFQPSRNKDDWYQAALTIEGKVGNWDLVYSGGYFGRKVANTSDYSYYTVAYDTYSYVDDSVDPPVTIFPGATKFQNAAGVYLDPSQYILSGDTYKKQTHELRVNSPGSDRFKITAGLFMQLQSDAVRANYDVRGLSTLPAGCCFLTPVSGAGDTAFLTRILRKDRDFAAFTEASYELTDTLTLTGGIRGFIATNTLVGFSGFQSNVTRLNADGSPQCLPTTLSDRPCNNVNKKQDQSGETHKINLSWQASPTKLLYATYSTGFRPGGNNRRPGILPFKADTLTNYEIGWKTSFLDRKLRINGAAFYEKWKDLQFGLVPLNNNGVTNTYNAGNARIWGIEGDISLTLGGLTLSGAGTYIDAKLTTDFCQVGPSGNIVCTPGVAPAAPRGTRLPVQPKFKGNLTARYGFDLGSSNAFVQASAQYQGGTRSFLTDADFTAVGPTKSFTTFDFSAGTTIGRFSVEAFIQNAFDNRGQLSLNTACSTTICGRFSRIYPTKPQLFGLKVGTKF